MSDWSGYATRLAETFDYTNTFLDEEPSLDIMSPSKEYLECYDFVICSEVLEHVPPPVSRAFTNLRRLLKPGGLLVLTVPYTEKGVTREQFPSLHEYELIIDDEGKRVLENVTPERVLRNDSRTSCFTAARGSRLEMRLFSQVTPGRVGRGGLHRRKDPLRDGSGVRS